MRFPPPGVHVVRKEGNIRLCIEFRLLNAVIKPSDFPMENVGISNLINQSGHENVISCLNVFKGYWEIPFEEKSCY